MIKFTKGQKQSIHFKDRYVFNKFKFTMSFKQLSKPRASEYLVSFSYNSTYNWQLQYCNGGLSLCYANYKPEWIYKSVIPQIELDKIYNILIEYNNNTIIIKCNDEINTYEDTIYIYEGDSKFMISSVCSYDSDVEAEDDYEIYKMEMVDLTTNKIALKYIGYNTFTSQIYDGGKCDIIKYDSKGDLFQLGMFIHIDDGIYNFSDNTHNELLQYVPYRKFDNFIQTVPEYTNTIYTNSKEYKNCLEYLNKHDKNFNVIILGN